jgi:DNA modification methylase
LRQPSLQVVISGDSRQLNIAHHLTSVNPTLYEIFKQQKVRGIFTSPPYVGQIDYHEQHCYAYELLGYKRKDNAEIGAQYKGNSIEARAAYVHDMIAALTNCKRFLSKTSDVFLVVDDKYGLYPEIAKQAGMALVQEFRRPVLRRSERDRGVYTESVLHLKFVGGCA